MSAQVEDVKIGFLRAFAAVVMLSFRASPWSTVLLFVLEPIGQLSAISMLAAIGVITDGVIGAKSGQVTFGAILLAVSFGMAYVMGYLGFNVRRFVSEKVTHYVDVQISRLTSGITGIEHLERPDYLDRIEMLRQDPQGIGNVINSLVIGLASTAMAIGAFVVLVSIHPLLAVVPLAGLVSMWTSARSQRRWREHELNVASTVRRSRHLFTMATSAAAGKELRVFNLGDEVARRHSETWEARERDTLRVTARDQIEFSFAGLAQNATSLGALAFLSWRALDGSVTAGQVVTVLLLGGQLGGALTSLIGNVRWIAGNVRTAERFLWLRDYAEAAAARDPGTADVPTVMRTGIALRGVSFTYPGTDQPVLRDVDLDLPAGSVVAVVGDNGAGKTTLVKLLCRLYDPTTGSVCVEGRDLRELPPDEWRDRLAAVFQDHLQLEFLARESVGAGDLPSIDDAPAVQAAVARAGATGVIERLDSGLETLLGRRWGGAELSGGEWQKVALARGLMRSDPLLTVFDEPTSALDAQTEHHLFKQFATAAKARKERGAITLLVSHRFSTVRNADLIVVIDDGRIVETGSHDELMARKGLYAELFTIQADAYRT